MKPSALITIVAPATAELTEKKSRFIGQAFPVCSEAEAMAQLAAVRDAHKAARHHVYAWVIGDQSEHMRSSDDGEPAGTAGRPLLEAIKSAGLQDVLLVVTRYFGGILLGSGGLTRAYAKTAQMTLDAASKIRKIPANRYALLVDYAQLSKVESLLATKGVSIEDKVFAEQICLICSLPPALLADLAAALADLSDGNLKLRDLGEPTYIIKPLEQ
jgi:uncharacterized YigZ family protein